MAINDDVRERIISSVFSRRNANGTVEESYVSHVKVWEDSGVEAEGMKPRYILLSRMSIAGWTRSCWRFNYSQRILAVMLSYISQS